MITDTKSISFGRYLKAIRHEKGISIEKIANEIKVAKNILQLIEKEDLRHLPDEVFVKGFLRAYTDAIGADGDLAVSKYLSSLRFFQETVRAESGLVRASSKFWPDLLLSLGALLIIIMLSVFFIPLFQDHTSHEVEENITANDQQSVDIGINPEIVQKETKGGSDTEKEPNVISEKLFLKIIAVEETWMKVIIDGQHPKEYSLKPGNSLELEADFGFNILAGNASGVRLFVNDKPLEVPGKSGQVVTIQIP